MSKYFPLSLLCLIIVSSFVLTLNASLRESATMDELAHIPAGYGYVKYLDFRLNPEHPPLVKALTAFPLLFQNLKFPTDKSSWQSDINGQWTAGAQFLYESGNDADKIIKLSRLGPMILTLILIIFIYIWSKELMGRWWALFPSFLFAFSPAVLAHGHYVTTDIGAALGIFIATYYFIKFLFQPSRRHLIFAGLIFGIAQLMKFSAVLLIPFFIFLIVVFYIWKVSHDWRETAPLARLKRFSASGFRYARYLILIFIIGYSLVYAFYFLFTVNYPVEKQISDTKFILSSFAGGPDANLKICSKLNPRCLADINVWMAGNKIFRPLGEYMLGVLMVMQRSSGGNTGYFLGEVSAGGWWYYFPVVFLLKEPLASLILIGLALLLGVWSVIKRFKIKDLRLKIFNYLGLHFAEFSMISFTVFYWLYSVKSPLNIGIRHILPTMPFIYILTASALKKWMNYNSINSKKVLLKSVVIAILAIWYFSEMLFATPYYLSYFNQIGGGTDGGYRYVTDSNYDWGQDLKRLKDWTDKNLPAGRQVAVEYFGGGSPKYYLGEKFEQWQSAKGNPKDYGIEWLAISINNLQSALGKLHPGQQRNPKDEYQWLKNPYEPYARAGTSIFIYKL
ncbi:glycosyltransferase family 39 protein [Candidatus Wolfebacteria bacterium]|nr:glycosyltransferase family 39 protein [Candidatus Wolfebacteria bacterium]